MKVIPSIPTSNDKTWPIKQAAKVPNPPDSELVTLSGLFITTLSGDQFVTS